MHRVAPYRCMRASETRKLCLYLLSVRLLHVIDLLTTVTSVAILEETYFYICRCISAILVVSRVEM